MGSPSFLSPEGPLARSLPGFEVRAAQARMMELVEASFRDDGVLLVEAGTGTGKTFAYLIPAVLWSAETGEKVVVATHTIALQEQILNKDLPLVAAALGLPIKAELVKGRGNYLCRRKVAEAGGVQQRVLDPSMIGRTAEDVSALQNIVDWVARNETGSRSELGFTPPFDLWEELRSDRDSCLRTRCSFHQSCFFYRARRAAAQAQILVANHHLVFADLAVKATAEDRGRQSGPRDRIPEGVLPPYRRIILDEAHHLEDVAASYFGMEASRSGVLRALQRLGGNDRKSASGGLVHRLAAALNDCAASERDRAAAWQGAAETLLKRIVPFSRWVAEVAVLAFADVQTWARSRPLAPEAAPRGRPALASLADSEWLTDAGVTPRMATVGDGGERRIRLSDEPDEAFRLSVLPALERLVNPPDGLMGLVAELKALRREITGPEAGEEGLHRDVAGPLVDLMGIVQTLERAALTLEEIASGDGPNPFPQLKGPERVRWVEIDAKGKGVRLVASPVDLGPVLAKNLFEAHATVVLTSATLSAGGDFSFLSSRLGVDRVVEGRAVSETLPSPFDWNLAAMIAVPTDLPAPDEDGFEDTLAERVHEALLVSEGGAFVLFTSYRLLQRVHAALAPRLAAAGLTVLRHGDGERHELLAKFRADGNAVLFATDSFWEGVDVPGNSLRNVILTRLPFRVPTDPVQLARAERIVAAGGDPFNEMTIPQAVIKFRQGLGRLIRTRTDRGILVVLDKRMVTRRYGRRFLAALPPARVETGDSVDVFRLAREFLKSAAESRPRAAEEE